VTFVGSYRLHKDEMTMIFAGGTRLADRPTDFAGKPEVEYVGSYRLDKDQMTLILATGDRLERRPTDFAGKSEFRFVLRRVKR
jgi:hypothetical protein